MSRERCSQTGCTYNPDNDMIPVGKEKDRLCSMCPICAECGEQPHVVQTTCKTCMACEQLPNRLRNNVDNANGIEIGMVEFEPEEIEVVRDVKKILYRT